MRGRHLDRPGGRMKNPGVGLAHTKLLGTDAGAEIVADTNALDIGIAIGQGHQRKAAGQEFECQQGIFKQRDPVALGVENRKRIFSQQGIFPGAIERQPDGLAPDGAQVVLELRARVDHVLANLVPRRGVGKQRSGHGRMLAEPVVQRLFGPFNGRPDRPQGIVEVQGNGFDKGQVKHGAV